MSLPIETKEFLIELRALCRKHSAEIWGHNSEWDDPPYLTVDGVHYTNMNIKNRKLIVTDQNGKEYKL